MEDQNNTPQPQYLNITKDDGKAVRWLHGGASKDDVRPVLTWLKVEDGRTVTADGFQLRIMETPPSLSEYAGKMIDIGTKATKASGEIIPVRIPEESEGRFPEYDQIIPTRKPITTITLNASLLAGILKDLEKGEWIHISIINPVSPIILQNSQRFALLMPAHSSATKNFEPMEFSTHSMQDDKLEDAVGNLIDMLLETHQDDINDNHGGDGPDTCTYCKAIRDTSNALGREVPPLTPASIQAEEVLTDANV